MVSFPKSVSFQLAASSFHLYNEPVMICRYKLLILLFVVMALPSGNGWAQGDIPPSEEALPDEGASAEFQDIRARVETLLEENKALETEHEALRQEFLKLQQDVDAQKTEIARLESSLGPAAALEVLPSNPVPAEEGGDLKQMQLDNLRYQKKELELELRSRKILLEALQKQRDAEIARLKQEDTDILERKKEVNRRIQEIKKEAPGYPQEIERLTRENDYLSGEIKKLERLIRSQKKEKKSLLKDDYDLSTNRLLKETIAEKERERKALQIQIEDLETKQTVLGKKEPLKDGGDLNRLKETARQIDEENQKLRNEIFSLRHSMSGPGPQGL